MPRKQFNFERACRRFQGKAPCCFLELAGADGSTGHVSAVINPKHGEGGVTCVSVEISTAWRAAVPGTWHTQHFVDTDPSIRKRLLTKYLKARKNARMAHVHSSRDRGKNAWLETAVESFRKDVMTAAKEAAATMYSQMSVRHRTRVRDFYYHEDLP